LAASYDNLTWEDLINGVDLDDLDNDLPVALPIAEFADKIPQGLPTTFIDKDQALYSTNEAQGMTLGVEQSGAPLYEWVTFPSTWLAMARFENTDAEATTGSMFVEFLTGALVRYDFMPIGMWVDFCRSKSKGQYVFYRIGYLQFGPGKGWPYELLRYPYRKVTQDIRDRHYQRTAGDGPDFHLRLFS